MPDYTPGSGSGAVRPQTSFPFGANQVGPHYEQPLPSQFVVDLTTGQPAIVPWGKTYDDVASGTVPGMSSDDYGPPPPFLSYKVTATGVQWSTDPADQPAVWSKVPPGNPPNYFPGGGLYEGYRGKADANYWVPDFSPTGAFPSSHPADAVKNLQLFSPGSPYIECFDAYSGEALCPTPAYPKAPPRLGMTPGSSKGAPLSPDTPGVNVGPISHPTATANMNPLVLVAGVILLLLLVSSR